MSLKKMYLKTSAAIVFAALLLPSFSGCTSATKKADEKSVKTEKELFIGLQLWSVKDAMKADVAGTLKAVGDMGYKFVETAGYADGKIYNLDPLEFKKLCESNGLQFLGAHTGQEVPGEENWDETMAWWDTCIAAHKAAGAKWIVQPWMGGSAYESLDGLKAYCKYFEAVGQKCNAAGIRFGYHNHDKEFITEYEGKPLYDWMLELTTAENVMFQLDLYWIHEGGKNALDYFENYPGRFELWHIKDEKELGESGNMDFAASFAQREKSGAKYGIVEVERYNFEPLESCKKSLEYLKAQDFVDFYE
ncbi:TIM barrel protein [uncultured Draconibacterium sp.]|uniref:sugar phosphate isomerase/epimerase family protein n=1 Tax=uncultured Draconibacterium sp. TaxID=1573823 RepID=UPI0032612F75